LRYEDAGKEAQCACVRQLLRIVPNVTRHLGTVDNHKNTEITETVIFIKCCECCDFAKMPRFLPKCPSFTFSQYCFCFNQHNLREFDTKIFIFPLSLLSKSVCFVTYWRNMWPWRHRSMYFT